MSSNWLEFWNGEHAIYVNDRHKMLHDRMVARDVAALIPPGKPVVLDFGCGEATEAAAVAKRCGRLYLSDAAPAVLARFRARHAGDPVIQPLSPEEVETLPDGVLDLVVVNSLLQYLSREELRGWLAVFRAKLKPGGALVLGDVIAPDVSPLTDASALLRFGFEGGFLLAALGGLVRTFFSDYRKLRSQLGLSTYSEEDIRGELEDAGFVAQRRHPNLGHNQARMTFIAHPL